jgi:subtilisin family serine protease
MNRTGLGTSQTGRIVGALIALILAVSLAPRASVAGTPILGGGIVGGERGGAQGGDGLQEIGQPLAAEAGYDGRGGTVVLLDTGVDYTRPEFGSCAKPGKRCRVIAALDIAPQDVQMDDSGHGTWTAAIVASVAPGAKIISLDVFDGGVVYDTDVAAALQWVLKNRAKYDITVVNMSVGHYREYHAQDCGGSILDAPIAAIRAAGILPVAAAGNQGTFGRKFTPGVSFPACVPGVVSVGAVYISSGQAVTYDGDWMKCRDATVTADEPACFSQSASNLDVWAPGAFVSAGPWAGGYGTSAAAPFVAGAAAVLAQAAPEASVAEIQGAITSAGPIVRDQRLQAANRVHRLDIVGAIAAIEA